MTNVAQPAASAGNDHHFARDLQALVFGVNSRVNVTVHALCKLEGGSELIRIDLTLCHFGTNIVTVDKGVNEVTQLNRRIVKLEECE